MRRETPRCLSAPCVVYDVRSFRYVNLNSTARACRIKFDVIRTFFQTTAVASGRRAVLPRGVEEVEPLRKLGEPFSAERSPARSRASFGDVARITAWPVREPSPRERESQPCRREHRIRTSEMPRGCRSADRSARARQAASAPRAARAGFRGSRPWSSRLRACGRRSETLLTRRAKAVSSPRTGVFRAGPRHSRGLCATPPSEQPRRAAPGRNRA